ncbi:MAG: tetratricopeptide repeat protein [Spirochaetes bacterium]|nr:tetratricopeptide repeat protein [Spirochaetota bacterium]
MQIYFFITFILVMAVFAFYLIIIKPKQDPYTKAVSLSKQNRFQEAITEFKKTLYSNPDSAGVHYKIAELYIRQKNYEQAVYHLNEIIRIDKYSVEVEKQSVIKNLAKAYYFLDDIEKAFQTYFDLIRENPEDAEAYYHVAFIALGQEEFEIAQRYFEKLVKLEDNFESFFGAGICSYQNNRNEDAVNYFKEALSIRPNSDIAILAIAFALGRIEKYSEAISYLGKLTERVADDNVIYISKRLLAFLNLYAGKNEEGSGIMNELLKFVQEKNLQEEIKLSLFDMGFASVKNNQLDKAYKYWNQLYQLDNNYENIKDLLNVIKKEIDNAGNKDGFENSIFDFVDDWISGSFPENFLWKICGLRSEKQIDIKNVMVSAKVKGRESFKTDTAAYESESDDRLDKFLALSNENFRMISNRLIFKLGYKVKEILNTYREADGVDILAGSQDNSEKILVWVRRWKGSNVGEITLRNFAQAINDIKAQKGLFITSAELTQAAQSSLKTLSKVRIFYPQETNELLKGLL